jgi:UDPglucose 6-dehydrogenase
MKVTVVGAGYVGLVTAACLAELGNQVVGVDHDHGRVALLQAGGVPIYEPGLDELVQRNLQAGRLSFTTGMPQALAHADVIFIAVGTPPQEDGSADLQHVLDAARQIGMHMRNFKVVVNKSTVPVGTGALVAAAIQAELDQRGRSTQGFAVVSNPEFLKEGAAIDDFMRPDRIVVGIPDGHAGEQARMLMTRLYAPFNRHHERTIWMDVPSAELTKYAANAMLATRISFMNEMANLADRVGADIDAVRRGVGADQRIGHSFLYAGTGYGGSCFPKDTRALAHTAAQHGLKLQVIEAVENVNRTQKLRLVQHVLRRFGDDLRGRHFAIWGLAFKPNTNDMREAPSRTVIRELLARGAELAVHDPVAMDEARRTLNADLLDTANAMDHLRFADTPMQALEGADALLVLTEWKCFQNPDFSAMRACMRQPVVLDGRNLYDPQQMEELGFVYQGIGRRNALARAALGMPTPSLPTQGEPIHLAL